MSKPSRTYHWTWQLKSSPEALWPYLADTNRINKALGVPELEIAFSPLDTGGSRTDIRAGMLGLQAAWHELPFNWVKNQWYSVTRRFEDFPLKEFHLRLTLIPNKNGTRCKIALTLTAANWLGWLVLQTRVAFLIRQRYHRTLTQIDEALQTQQEEPFSFKAPALSLTQLARLKQLGDQLTTQGSPPDLVENLVHLIAKAPDIELDRMQPYVLADRWGFPRRTVLTMFLSGAKNGLLKMQWDVLCPSCRGGAGVASLSHIHADVHCEACNIDFTANFSQNIELTFLPHPQVREVISAPYCSGGPMLTPHIVLHQMIDPGEAIEVDLAVPAKRYRARTAVADIASWVDLPGNDIATGQLLINAATQNIGATYTASEHDPLHITIRNDGKHTVRVYLEESEWYTNAVTALEVTTMQHFRDLFSDEVLRPGDEIGVQGMTILFSDLVGSTRMYNLLGDAPSYALVRDQFSFLQEIVRAQNGAIVKTIGDAIMAAFVDPRLGFKAALEIQRQVTAFNQTQNKYPLIIKLGLHHGPCIAVNLNGRLDYFGATVNLASRLESYSRGNDVVISQAIHKDPAVREMLAELDDVVSLQADLKGFEDQIEVYRIMPNSPAVTV